MFLQRLSPCVRGTVLVAAILGLSALGWPDAEAGDTRVDELCSVCESPIGPARRAMVLEELRAIDSSDSRKGLESLAESDDDVVATMAIATIGRDDYSGARSTLKKLMGDASSSDAVRSAALVAWCNLRKKDGKAWTDIEGVVKKAAGTNKRVKDSATAVSGALFQTGGE